MNRRVRSNAWLARSLRMNANGRAMWKILKETVRLEFVVHLEKMSNIDANLSFGKKFQHCLGKTLSGQCFEPFTLHSVIWRENSHPRHCLRPHT